MAGGMKSMIREIFRCGFGEKRSEPRIMAERKTGFIDLLIFLLIFVISTIFQNFLLGIIILFFIPGYLLIQVMYQDEPQNSLGLSISLSIGISAVVSGIIGLLHYYFIGNEFSVLISLWLIIGILWVLAALQRLFLGESKNNGGLVFPKVNFGDWGFIKGISVTALLIIFGYYFWLTSNQQPRFTEFYMLGPSGLTTGYPTEVYENTPLNITIGVVNHEGEHQNYTIVGMVGEEPIGALHPFEVPDSERREGELTLIFPHAGDNQRVDVWLGGDGLEYPYRSLTLWVNVLGEDQ
jgi:uncharacterized membrane protein